MTVPLAPIGPARPAFAREFPREPRLDALVAAFGSGDYAAVRAQAPALISGPDPEVARAARTLLGRTTPDRGSVMLMAMTAVLLIVVAWYWIAHGHAPDEATPTPAHRSP
jgi:hypothetical protein